MSTLKLAAFAAFAVAFLFSGTPGQAAEFQVFELQLNEPLDSLGERIAESRAQHERLGTGGVVRGFRATLAGPDTGRVVVIVEYESAEARRAGQALIDADSETAAMLAARQAAGNTLTSASRWVEITPSDN